MTSPGSAMSRLDRDQRIAVMRLLEEWIEAGVGRSVTQAHAFDLTRSPRFNRHTADRVALVDVAIEAVVLRPRPLGP